ncbi:hypothetical protein CEK71_19415 [Methylovulum psychrotolerans]|uniref:Uncharacterized protein n=1 Tax=Methylovulum psychrotolerans TaxID=1704499 RepID=A0A1Z4C3I2_9GAMM|nr:hypothetical protein CEK71_19415 [Methylovulum psychrotolerans]
MFKFFIKPALKFCAGSQAPAWEPAYTKLLLREFKKTQRLRQNRLRVYLNGAGKCLCPEFPKRELRKARFPSPVGYAVRTIKRIRARTDVVLYGTATCYLVRTAYPTGLLWEFPMEIL